MLKDQGNYNANCPPGTSAAPSRSKDFSLVFALRWTLKRSIVARKSCLDDRHLCADLTTRCAWQESHLAVLWTIGVFALNFGPVVVGPILDYVGPKLTAIFGEHQSLPDLVSKSAPCYP